MELTGASWLLLTEEVATMPRAAAAAARQEKEARPRRQNNSHLRLVTEEKRRRSRGYEFAGIGLLAAAVLIGLALGSFHPARAGWPPAVTGRNMIGPFGALIAEGLFSAIGVSAYLLVGGLLLFGIFCFVPKRIRISGVQAAGLLVALVGASTIAHIALLKVTSIPYPPGGLLGAVAGDLLARSCGQIGTSVIAGAALAIGVLLATDLSVTTLGQLTGAALQRGAIGGYDFVVLQRERLRLRAEKRAERKAAALAEAATEAQKKEETQTARTEKKKQRREAVLAKATELAEADVIKEERQAEEDRKKTEQEAADATAAAAVAAANAPEAAAVAGVDNNDTEIMAPAPLDRAPLQDPPWTEQLDAPAESAAASDEETASAEQQASPVITDALTGQPLPMAAPRIIEYRPKSKREQKKLIENATDERPQPYGASFQLPPLNLLDYEASEVEPVDASVLTDNAEKLVKIFKDYGIEGTVREIRPGPVVTTYEFVPAAGTRIARIASLADDLAMAMEAIRVRVVAPIPGKGAVGIEIPNEKRQSVYFKEIIASSGFQRSTSKLAMALGKDIEGHPYHVDLARMPHMLIAGTTGSGKSVAINAMILSILYKATPDEVRFLMVDPKMLELSLYEGIPHLLLPPVTDPKKAATALRWAVEEMERRYQTLAETGVRDIVGYNKKVDKLREAAGLDRVTKSAAQNALGVTPEATAALPPADAMPATATKKRRVMIRDERNVIAAEPILDAPSAAPAEATPAGEATPAAAAPTAASEDELTAEDSARTPDQIPERLPYIVVVVDEFADLMMVASRDVETYIARLAQKARACGIHLLLATQRPSTDVITGVIKANFPVRMSFQVASNHDSRTIINAYGAEKLLGRGDMLLIPPGTSALLRCHGAFVSDDEIKRVVDFLKAQGAPHYDENILRGGDEEHAEGGDGADEEYDEHFDSAVAIVAETRQVSISMIQRRLKIGYNRAARIVERMEKDGLVGPQYPGNKPREVFVAPIAD